MNQVDVSYEEELEQEIIERARKIYSEEVIDHWRNPRNLFCMDNPDGHATGLGSCGDNMEIFIRVENNKIVEASFQTNGCITSVVSGSMTVELAQGRDLTEAGRISGKIVLEGLGGLPEESAHCAELAADTLQAAIRNHLISNREPWKKLYRSRPIR